MTNGSAVDAERPPSHTQYALADALALAASAIVVAAVLQLAAAVAVAIHLEHPPSQLSGFRYRLLLVAQGVNAFTAVLLVIAVAFVALFAYFVEDADTRLPRQWRPSVLWAVVVLGGLAVLLNIADMVNIQTASFASNAGFRVRQVFSDLAALSLASAALWLAWGRLRPPPSLDRTSADKAVEDYLS